MDDKQREAALQRWRQKCKPMPAQQGVLVFNRIFSLEEWQKLSLGVIPRQMEDKWFIYREGFTIFFHRSWTGFCVYQFTVEQQGHEYTVREAIINREEEQYRARDVDYESALLNFLIEILILGRSASFPVPSGLPNSVPTGLFQHHVSGTAFPETPMSDESDGGHPA